MLEEEGYREQTPDSKSHNDDLCLQNLQITTSNQALNSYRDATNQGSIGNGYDSVQYTTYKSRIRKPRVRTPSPRVSPVEIDLDTFDFDPFLQNEEQQKATVQNLQDFYLSKLPKEDTAGVLAGILQQAVAPLGGNANGDAV